VRGQVAEEDIAPPEGLREDVLDVPTEGMTIVRAIEHPGGGHAGERRRSCSGYLKACQITPPRRIPSGSRRRAPRCRVALVSR